MTITAVAKAQILIGAKSFPTDQQIPPVLTDYTGDTYTPIGRITTIGEFGDAAEEIKVTTISDSRVYKLKGPRDAGDLQLECAFDGADAGQLAAMAAMNDDGNRSFTVVLNDALTTAGKGTTTYFRGMVTAAQTKMGAANTSVALTIKIAINSAPITVAAS